MKYHLTNPFKKVKEKLDFVAIPFATFLASVLPTSVSADDPFAKVNTLSNQGTTKFQGIAIGIFSLALVVTGLIYGFGGREIRAKIKEYWWAIALAVVVVFAGVSIITWFAGFVKGSG